MPKSTREVFAAARAARDERRNRQRLSDAALFVGFIIGISFGVGVALMLPEFAK